MHIELCVMNFLVRLLSFPQWLAIQKLRVITGWGSHGAGKSKLKQMVWILFINHVISACF